MTGICDKGASFFLLFTKQIKTALFLFLLYFVLRLFIYFFLCVCFNLLFCLFCFVMFLVFFGVFPTKKALKKRALKKAIVWNKIRQNNTT